MSPISNEFLDRLRKNYCFALNQEIGDTLNKLKMADFCYNYEPESNWAVGPFRQDERLTFKKQKPLFDPLAIGWTSSFIFNPSLLVKDDKLYLFYRAGVKKESLGSRVGLAVYEDGKGWQEYKTPLLYPTEDDEELSIDDPKVYQKEDGSYVMFYNGAYNITKELSEKYSNPIGDVGVNIKCATSIDLINWEKRGLVVPLDISRTWAKGAVIPRNGHGEAVRINGEYLMFLSEGCGGEQYIGFSDDLIHWNFKQKTYLKLPEEYGDFIYEVACAITGHNGNDLVLDYFYRNTNGDFAAAQALYSIKNPYEQLDNHKGGTLAWGGLSIWRDKWIYPQGWESPLGIEEMYFYTAPIQKKFQDSTFFGEGFFDWQYSSTSEKENIWEERGYNPEKYWGGFSKTLDRDTYKMPSWALQPIKKYVGNPVFAPNKNSWDKGHFGGGVHNGSIIKKDGILYYIYRGEIPHKTVQTPGMDELLSEIDYICDIGIAVSKDGITFQRLEDIGPLFRYAGDEKYSFEDVCVVEHESLYYLYCNRWNWHDPVNPNECGVFLAVSTDLQHWEKKGLVFPHATSIHRNACVVQNLDNQAVRVKGKFVMYLNNGLIAYSDNLLDWKSETIGVNWPGGEGCVALSELKGFDDDIVLFTGGHHTGHFYAIGEVLFSADNPTIPKDYLQLSVLSADEKIPYENGFDAFYPEKKISHWRDTVFFTGITRFNGKIYIYYGGSEYYTCLAIIEGEF